MKILLIDLSSIHSGFIMPGQPNHLEGDISAVSNELEFCLQGVEADAVIEQAGGTLELIHEVNRRNIVELMISMAPDVAALNQLAPVVIGQLATIAQGSGGDIYSGSSLFQDTSHHEPTWYRTTSLSERLARGFLDITSQQLVIGVAREGRGQMAGETFGLQLYNFLRQLSPVILALSASSPCRYQAGNIIETGYQSRRPARYQEMSKNLPPSMFTTPQLHSLEEYHAHLQDVSDQVNDRLEAGQLDANVTELYRDRGERTYVPFTTLEPHQIYSWVRMRPDHANQNSVFSLEVRICDLPAQVETIQALNSFIAGLSYYAARNGFFQLHAAVSELHVTERGFLPILLHVAQNGLSAKIGNGRHPLRDFVRPLCRLAIEGLKHRHLPTNSMEAELSRILEQGNDAVRIREFAENKHPSPQELESFLVATLADSLSRNGGS